MPSTYSHFFIASFKVKLCHTSSQRERLTLVDLELPRLPGLPATGATAAPAGEDGRAPLEAVVAPHLQRLDLGQRAQPHLRRLPRRLHERRRRPRAPPPAARMCRRRRHVQRAVDLEAASSDDLGVPSTEAVEVRSGRRVLACRCIRLRCSCSRSEAVIICGRFSTLLLLLLLTATEEEPDEDEADRSRTVAETLVGDLLGDVLSAVDSDPMAE